LKILTQLIQKLGIYLTSEKLPIHIKGFYYTDTYHDIIVINKNVTSELEFREILSHELGHYFTSVFTNPLASYSEYLNILNTQRNEFRAIRWACNYLVPTFTMMHTLKQSAYDIDDICSYFDVSKELLMMKLYMMSLEQNSWHIEGNRYLMLSSLPSVYIFKKI